MASTSYDTIEEMVNINKEKKKNVFDYHSILLFTNQWLNGDWRRIGNICNGGSMVERDTLIQPCLIFVFFSHHGQVTRAWDTELLGEEKNDQSYYQRCSTKDINSSVNWIRTCESNAT